MQLTIEDISPVEKRVDFEVPWPEVAAKLDKAYDKLRREVRLKGFRPGKVPRQVVEKLYKARVEDDVSREVVEMAIVQAVQEKQIAPIAPPSRKRSNRAGTPTTMAFVGTSRVTTAPAPTTAPVPMLTPASTMHRAPNHTSSPIVTGAATHPWASIPTPAFTPCS